MASLASLYPDEPINVSHRLRVLPSDGSIPDMPGWQWIHTPGHTPGHVSLWRPEEKILIAGDAFITTCQESAFAVVFQKPEMHGPPIYFTPDWHSAEDSVKTLARLEPESVIAGHGRAMQGIEMRRALKLLSQNFREIALPKKLRGLSN